MSLLRAPTDLRMPISCVRSVTTASMMFMITTPPTTMNTDTTATAVAAMAAVNWSQNFTSASDGQHGERIVVLRTQVAVRAQQRARFFLRLHQVIVVHRDGRIVHPAPRAPHFEECLRRNDHEVVLRLPEHRALRLRHPHHLERQPFQRDRLPDRIAPRKKFDLDVVADEHGIQVPARFRSSEMNRPSAGLKFRMTPMFGVRPSALPPRPTSFR